MQLAVQLPLVVMDVVEGEVDLTDDHLEGIITQPLNRCVVTSPGPSMRGGSGRSLRPRLRLSSRNMSLSMG